MVSYVSHPDLRLFATPQTTVSQAPPSIGFSRQEYWSRVPLPSPWEALSELIYKMHCQDFPGGTVVKTRPSLCRGLGFNPWVGKISWRRKWQPTLVFLHGKSHGWRSLVGYSPWGCKESDTTEQFHFHFSLACIGEGNGNPLQCSCLENPRDGGVWWAAVYGVTQSRT